MLRAIPVIDLEAAEAGDIAQLGRGAGRDRGTRRGPGGQPRRAAGPRGGPERPDGPAAQPAAGGEGEAGQPASLPRLAAVAGRLRAARARALQRGPVRRRGGGPGGGPGRGLPRPVRARQHVAGRRPGAAGRGVRVHRGVPAAGGADARAVRHRPGAARGRLRPGRPAAPAADRERLPDLDVPRGERGRGQAAAARARGRLGGHRPGAAGRLRGTAAPGAGRRLDRCPGHPGRAAGVLRDTCWPGGPAGGCARAGTGWSRAAR